MDVRPALHRGPRRRRRGVARPLRRRGARGRASPSCCMHGEPSWAYLYRKMIPVLIAAGLPRRRARPRRLRPLRQAHRAATTTPTSATSTGCAALLDAARPARRHARRPGLGRPDRPAPGRGAPRPLRARRRGQHASCRPATARRARRSSRWQEFSQTTPSFHVGGIVKGGCATDARRRRRRRLRRAVPRRHVQGRRAAVPDARADAPRRPGVGAEPRGVGRRSSSGRSPFLTAFSDQDPITRGADRVFQARVPGAKGQPHTTIEGGGHFLQEDKGEELANVIVEWLAGS